LFPSQTAEEAKLKLSGQSTEEDEKKKQQDKESWEDIKMMMIIMGSIITFITVLLVRIYIPIFDRN
jgi:farnesyl-diphosphate farnesyltransferase